MIGTVGSALLPLNELGPYRSIKRQDRRRRHPAACLTGGLVDCSGRLPEIELFRTGPVEVPLAGKMASAI
ncbi:hypothetical protein [Collimonas humicola]|uniref:hypothetical protein n=1 Tax=Collimonas humicola TaxID=2825886 RepID=UPI001B8A96F9|nr:hypothetical protein [Collimonas humicola]